MFIFYNGFIFIIIAQMSIFSIIFCPIITIYFFLNIIFKLIIHLLLFTIYNVLKILTKGKLIKNTFFFSCKFNPFHYLYLKEKTRHYKTNHISKQVNVVTFDNNQYNGELKYIMDMYYVRIDNIYIKYDIIKELKLNSMYRDIYNYKITNVSNNYPKYLPNEINDIIESYLFSRKKTNRQKFGSNFINNNEIFTTYILYQNEYEYV